MSELSPRSVLVQNALREAGATGEIRDLGTAARTAAEAAEEVHCEVGAIANSLVFLADGEPLLIMTSGRHRVDTAYVAGRIGVGSIDRADPATVRAATGQVIGGVAPVGHPTRLRTLVDTALADYPEIWAAGGTPHTLFPTTYDELVAMTGGTPTAVTEHD